MPLTGAAAQWPLTGTRAVLALPVELRSLHRFEQPAQPGRLKLSACPAAPTLSVVGIPSWRGIVVKRSLAPARSLSNRRRAAFRPPIRTAQSTPSILGTLPDGPNAQRRRNSELARPIRLDAVTWAGPVVVDDFPQEIPITRRELDVIETYLGALLDDALGVPE
jgi:hypothetical protein